MRNFHYNAPILVGDTWYNMDGTVEQAKDHALMHFKPSDYAKAVTLNNKIMAALFCLAAIVGIAYKVL